MFKRPSPGDTSKHLIDFEKYDIVGMEPEWPSQNEVLRLQLTKFRSKTGHNSTIAHNSCQSRCFVIRPKMPEAYLLNVPSLLK